MFNNSVYKVNALLGLTSDNLQIIHDAIKDFSSGSIEMLLEYLSSGCSKDFLFYKVGRLSSSNYALNLLKVKKWSDDLNKFDEMVEKIKEFNLSKENSYKQKKKFKITMFLLKNIMIKGN